MVAVAVLGAGVIGAGATMFGADKAANAQEHAADNASNTQMAMFNADKAILQPYVAGGEQGLNMLTSRIGDLTTPINMDETTLRNTPGYQFNLTQGLKATQNSAAARGLGVSGAALKGAAGYATGLADSTYQNQFNNANTNQSNAYNRLMGLTQIGQASAAGVGSAGIATGNSIASNTIGAGNAAAAADMAGAAGITSAGNSAANAYSMNAILRQMQNGGVNADNNFILGN